MTKSKQIPIKNNGGEIRGYNVLEYPKAIPTEQTGAIILPMKGAGDAVKSGFANEAGTRSALKMYQDGDKVGEDEIDEQQNEQDLKDLKYLQKYYGNQLGNKVNLETYRRVKNMTPEQRLEISGKKTNKDIDPDASFWTRFRDPKDQIQYYEPSPEDTYLDIERLRQRDIEKHRKVFDYNKTKFDALIKRYELEEKQRKLVNALTQNHYLELADLEDIPEEDLTLDQQIRIRELRQAPWNDDLGKIQDALYDIDIKLGTDITNKYDDSKFSSTRQDRTSRMTHASQVNDWLTENLGWIGEGLGETYISGHNLFGGEGSIMKTIDALGDKDTTALKAAASELGLDLFNVVGLLTIATGGAPLTVIKGLGKGLTAAAAKTVLKNALTTGFKGLKTKWKLLSPKTRMAIKFGAYGGVPATLGLANLGADMVESGDVLNTLFDEYSEHIAAEVYGLKGADAETLRKVRTLELDPSKTYQDADDYLKKEGIQSFEDQYRFFHPEEEVPEYVLNLDEERELGQFSYQGDVTPELQWDDFTPEEFEYFQNLKREAEEGLGTEKDQEDIEEIEQGNKTVGETIKERPLENADPTKVKVVGDEKTLSKLAASGDNTEYEALLEDAKKAYGNFSQSVSGNEKYQYLQKKN